MSIKYKIVLLFVALVTLIVTIGGAAVYFFSAREQQATFRTRLKNRAIITARVYAGLHDDNYSVLHRMNSVTVASLYNKSITIKGYDKSHDFVYADLPGDTLLLNPAIIAKTTIGQEYYFTHGKKKAIAMRHEDVSNNFVIAIAALDLDGKESLKQLQKILLLALALAAALSWLAGLIFARNIIRPIKRITGEVNLISSNDLSQRIKINEASDELTQLAATFNHLLDRLEDSFTIQRRFISNASHELSTPLTSISSQVEVAMQKNRSPEEYREVMQSVHEDIQELQQLTRSLLDIAKTGSQGSLDLLEVRLDEVLFKVIGDVKKHNHDYKATLNFEVFPDDEQLICIFGNANLLYIAFKNIIENGCKYADNHQSTVEVAVDKTLVNVKVTNKGDVIAEADIHHIFQPFFRTGTAQQKPGFGLGLTLTKRILSLHKGTITVSSHPDTGTIFTICLPNILATHQ